MKLRFTRRNLSIVLSIALIALVIVAPIYAQGGRGKGNGGGNGSNNDQPAVSQPENSGNGGGNGHNNNQPGNSGNGNGGNNGQPPDNTNEQPTQPAATQPAAQVSASETLLACQKNNPERADCSSLEVTGYCEGSTAVFVIRNTGEPGDGDMLSSTAYRIYEDGQLVESGPILLDGGATITITYTGSGTVRLEADQQVGHPGSSQPNISLSCGGETQPPTEEVTVEPTEESTPEPTEESTPEPTEESTPEATIEPTEEITPEPTEEITPDPTEEVLPPDLSVEPLCLTDGSVAFIVTNNGPDMNTALYYTIASQDGVIQDGWVYLYSGESTMLEAGLVAGPAALSLDGGLYFAMIECFSDTPEEPLPPDLQISAECLDDGRVAFTVTNYGGAMSEPLYYEVSDEESGVYEQGGLQLAEAESLVIVVGPAETALTLNIDWRFYSTSPQCSQPTPEPTEEPTPDPTEEVTPEPTEEPTPEVTPEPTEEPTPDPTEEVTPEPTEEPTEEPTTPVDYACQSSDPNRLDCSSLKVTATCEGDVAVFTIYNGGEPGEGDMIMATEYRLYVDGVLIESGDVLLEGRTSMEIRYDGAGRITLEADQQVGHPGKSQPRTTITCSR